MQHQSTENLLQLARTNFRAFIAFIYPDYVFSPFHTYLANKLDALVNGEIDRLCLSMPPRHGKSMLVSELLPAYALGRCPLEQIMAISYSASLAHKFGSKVRNTVMASPEYKMLFPHSCIPGDGKTGAEFSLEQWRYLQEANFDESIIPIGIRPFIDLWQGFGHGSYMATGVGGGITGKPATPAIADDPIRNRADANSPTYVRKLHSFFGPDFMSRLEPGARMLVVHTRWTPNDLIGYIEKELNDDGEWEIISFPAIAESEDELGRKPGEALFEAKYPISKLQSIRKAMKPADWQALYQQNPTLGQSNSWKPEYASAICTSELPQSAELVMRIASLDCASELHEFADYTAITIWDKLYSNRIEQRHAEQARLDFNGLLNKLLELDAEYSPDLLLIEKASNGIALGQYLDVNYPSIPYEFVSAHRNKRQEFSTACGELAKGQYAFSSQLLLAQLAEFPLGEHDDLAITAIQAINWLALNKALPARQANSIRLSVSRDKHKLLPFAYGIC